MDITESNPATVPYHNLGKVLLNCIFDALFLLVEFEKKQLIHNANKEEPNEISLEEIKSRNNDLTQCFKDFFNHSENVRGINPHFSIGNKSKENFESRLSKIVLKSYYEIVEESKSMKGFGLPSPLSILYQMLIVPSEPQSAAYSLMFCRTLLFESLKVFPEHPLLPKDYRSFNVGDINNYLDTFYSYTKQSNNIPKAETISSQHMLAQFLAMKKVFFFRFGKESNLLEKTQNKTNKTNENIIFKEKIRQIDLALEYLKNKSLTGISVIKKSFEFHKYSNMEELPESETLMNELAGIPIPIRGAEIIFQGGIKTDSNSNLVIRISGEPGSGKTSFVLALCAALSPFNTFSYYMSFEENPKDLKNRLYSIIPFYLKKLSIFDSEVDSWFLAEKISIGNINKLNYFESEYIDRIAAKLSIKKAESNKALPAICPLIIVIDSIRVLINEENANLEKFIEKCKKLNAVIILISSNNEKFHNDIDYMVDSVIHLKHIGIESQKEKPTRIIQLTKTRHQSSRPGSHVFHLSGDNGFRIAPQLPSQIDKKEKILKPTPSVQYYINFFNEGFDKKNVKKSDKLFIWETSQILFHGYGSTGKAGLALSVLLSPICSLSEKSKNDYYLANYRRKVLVISLLYPESYYIELKKRINKRNAIQNEDVFASKIECIYFYSGYLTPEDFISRILRKLDEAILEGEPFTGILLDGLHNVSLQFQKLQESDMVWPALYSLLAKYYVTIVTTFTNFIIGNEYANSSIEDEEIILKGQKPLLHALVQATDFHFNVQPTNNCNDEKIYGNYIVSLKSAIRHKLKNQKYIWDRENLLLTLLE